MESAASSTSDARALAAELAGRDDASLEALLSARGVSAAVSWHDFFDAAEALLEASSIDRALSRLPRTALSALARGPENGARLLHELALTRPDGTAYRAVADRVRETASEHPDAFTPAVSTRPPAPADDRDAAAAAERAALAVAALADVLLLTLATPLARTGVGAVSAADRRRVIDAGAVATGDELDDILAGAAAAALARPDERVWVTTEAGTRWLTASTTARWQAVAEGFRDALPDALRTAEGGVLPFTQWPGAYPLDPEWPARAAQLLRGARLWGLVTPDGTEPAWSAPLRAGGAPDSAALAALLPPEIDRIYLQADLSAIAPGPLKPALDLRLRDMAVRESRAQASTYRFSAESIAHAVAGGETAESLRAFLSELSLTGIPQPLAYLLERTAARHGLIRVAADAASGGTRVESDDPGLLDTLEVDQTVRPIGLLRNGDALTSRVARDAVYWTLADARYPVIAVRSDGTPEPLRRRRPASDDAPVAPGAHSRLIASLRAAHEGDADAAWLGRELDAAVRNRATIVVLVALPDGTSREFTLEATGLGGGRLRGRDRASDTERTLPVSSIVSARPA